MDVDRVKRIIEGVLFISDKPVALKKLKDAFAELDYPALRELLTTLNASYAEHGHAFRIQEVAGGYHLVTDPELAPAIKRALSLPRPPTLSKAALEALAVIAYRQPLTKAEVEAVRGVDGTAVLETLLEHRFIKVVGRKESPGRPLLYGTTDEFLRQFGLKNLEALPEMATPAVPGFDAEPATPLVKLSDESTTANPAPADRPVGSAAAEPAQSTG